MEIEGSKARVSPLAEQVVDGFGERRRDGMLDGKGAKDGTTSVVL